MRDFVDERFAREDARRRKYRAPGPMQDRQIHRHITGLDRGNRVRKIVNAPGITTIKGGVPQRVRSDGREIMKRSRLRMFPGDRFVLRVQPDRKKMRGGRLKMAMLHVVRARPEDLDR